MAAMTERTERIVETLTDAFSDLMDANPVGGFWRSSQQQGSDLFDRLLEA
jgi:hypothetical protein